MDIARILTTYPITYVFLVPSVISLLRNYIPDISIQSLRMLLLGGEPVSKVLLDIIKPSVPNASIWNFYGPTEATVGVVIGEIGNVNVEDLYNDIIPIGKPMPGVMALIMNEGEVVSKTGEKGELWVGGDQVTVGYVNDDIKNMNSFQYVDYKGKSERFYTTGDLVSMNSKGNYTYCGRKDYQVKIQGYRIELNEIEYHAAQSSKTRAVVVVHEAEGNQQLYLFLENYLGETGIVTRYLEQKLPPFMVPKDIIVMHQFPISSSGKVDRMKLLHEVSD
jgi:non-ribosomal peptide synthetase component F